jgi:hypothetical protein
MRFDPVSGSTNLALRQKYKGRVAKDRVYFYCSLDAMMILRGCGWTLDGFAGHTPLSSKGEQVATFNDIEAAVVLR